LDFVGQDDLTSTTPIEFDVGTNIALADEILVPRGVARPPLSGDPMSYTQEQLISAGFPRRPDPNKSATSYANWLRIVSQTATRITDVTPHLHGIPSSACIIGGSYQASCTNTVWSGGVATIQSFGGWELVEGLWDVPSISGQAGSACPSTQSNIDSMWTGLGGWGNNGLIQAVTFLTATVSRNKSCGTSTVTQYQAYAEYFDGFQTGQNVNKAPININAGDEIAAEAWSSSSSSCYPFSTNGAFGCYYIYDYNNNQEVSTFIPQPTVGTPFPYTDSAAEWIIENPNSAGQFLADYGSTNIQDGEVDTTMDDTLPAYDLTLTQVALVATANNNTVLSSAGVATYPSDNISFTWENPGP